MLEWTTSIQPPGPMKMRLMHHPGHQAHQAVHDGVCRPHIVTLLHEQLHVWQRNVRAALPVTMHMLQC